MNFSKFYKNIENRIIDTALSLWATGDAEMQQYLMQILTNEKLLAKPIFQNMFPWEPSQTTFGQLANIFHNDFINRLNNISNPEYQFPADRHPYLHQEKSWHETLVNKKSILVTTGTGSGKTECFMLPVLQDIFSESRNKAEINAIFLYPLNALIGSQKKRMHEWCNALGGIRYDVYNGNTSEVDRNKIRTTPPQILFTNPTMLEYMLVRKKDITILEKSKGKLRWILLDEAHTLTGAKAAEMALLIRRVVEAFEIDIHQLRFALTSATVGSGNKEALKKFMSDLCGINKDNIVVIEGNRILPAVNPQTFNQNGINSLIATNIRQEIYNKACLDLSKIGEMTSIVGDIAQLEFVDKLTEIKENGQPVMPVRGHFFARNINGLFACTNPICDIHPYKPENIVSTLTTISKKKCSCGYPLLELISCRTCGSFMLEGEKRGNVIQQKSNAYIDFFEIDEAEDIDEGESQNPTLQTNLIIAKQLNHKPFVDEDILPIQINQDGNIDNDTNGPFFEVKDNCPYCGSNLKKPFHFRLSASFLNRLISDVVLEQTNDSALLNNEMLWNGKKYISFTDSRQGTAKISALINIDSENYYTKSRVFHHLSKFYKENIIVLNEQEREELKNELEVLKVTLPTIPPIVQRGLNSRIIEIRNQLEEAPQSRQNYRISWNAMKTKLVNDSDAKNLFYNNYVGNFNIQGNDYCNSLLYNEFARRLPRERSLENLGMVNLVYPALENLIAPDIAINLNINNEEWKHLLKIALDYVIRYKFFYSIPMTARNMASTKHKSYKIYPSNSNLANVLKWPTFDRNRIIPNRLALIICAGLGYHELADIDNTKHSQINDLLSELWKTIRINFLSAVGTDGGCQLDLENKTAFELTDKLWLCPVKNRLLDTVFKGYSPWISGRLTSSNIKSFKVDCYVFFPIFPHPFNHDINNNYNIDNTVRWFEQEQLVSNLKQAGLWNSLHERVINFKPLYLAGEHSAQQKKIRLEKLEEKFQNGNINILSCSTTMEMGVDIGGISAVVMSNVPPGPSNYLQRTGRAGRRGENKSLALTICPANPIGSHVIENPQWALDHKISPPVLSFSSNTVVERHLNALLLGKFVREILKGINIREKVVNFFFPDPIPEAGTFSQQFLAFLLKDQPQNLLDSIRKVIKNTPLSEINTAAIIQIVYSNFNSIKEKVEQINQNFEASLNRILELPDYSDESPAYKAINYQKKQFLYKNLLTYLSDEGFLPAGGIPTGIVEFNNIGIEDLDNNREKNEKLPSYHITRALTEYSPGMEVVIDGWTYTSAGIILQNNFGGQTTKSILQHCTNCGHEHIISSGQIVNNNCPVCDNNTLTGLGADSVFTEIIEPVGFAVDLFSDKKRNISESSNAQYLEPLLIGAENWGNSTHPIVEYRDSLPNAEIVYYNYGNGNGYSICLDCGRAELDSEKLSGHNRLRGGKNNDKANQSECDGNDNQFAIRNNVMLVGRFQTEFFEIRCKDIKGNLINDEATLYSIGHLLSKSLCTYLAIEEQEVDFGIKKYKGFKTIFLFDTAKGGAGYVSQCASNFEEVCSEALNIVSRNCCDSACIKCMIDRKSQHRLEYLDRNLAKEWLLRLMDNTVPNWVLNLLHNNTKKVVGTVKTDLARFHSKKQIKSVTLLVDSDTIDRWDVENFILLNQLKIHGVVIQLAFRGQPQALTIEQKLTLLQVKALLGITTLTFIDNYNIDNLLHVASVNLNIGTVYNYYSENFDATLNENWGNSDNNFTYRQQAIEPINLNSFELNFDVQNVFETFIPTPNIPIDSDKIFDLFLEKLPQNAVDKLQENLEDQNVTITYSDRYIMSPFGCLLLIHFISRIKNKYNINILKLNIILKNMNNRDMNNARYINLNFPSDNERSAFLTRITDHCELQSPEIITDRILPHYRYMKIENNQGNTITIRPDAGIEHGWFPVDQDQITNDIFGDTEFPINQRLNNDLLYTLTFNQ